MEGPQQSRANKLLSMSGQQLSVVTGLLTLANMVIYIKLEILYAEGVSTAIKLLLNTCYVNVTL